MTDLEILCVGDDLNDSEPNFVRHVISSKANEFKDLERE